MLFGVIDLWLGCVSLVENQKLSEQEDFLPAWLDDKPAELTPGSYIWTIRTVAAQFKDQEREKPYAQIDCLVLDGQFINYQFPFRLYLTKAARNWATYFMRKFEYPAELLEAAQPVVRRSALENLTGKVLVEVTDGEYGLKFDVKGFSRPSESELEDKLKPKEEVKFESSEPSVDLEADVKGEPDLSFLDSTQ